MVIFCDKYKIFVHVKHITMFRKTNFGTYPQRSCQSMNTLSKYFIFEKKIRNEWGIYFLSLKNRCLGGRPNPTGPTPAGLPSTEHISNLTLSSKQTNEQLSRPLT